MQYLTQIVVAVLLLWNVTVSKSASTASREFLSSLDTSDDDLSEDSSHSSHRDLSPSRPDSSSSAWRVGETVDETDGGEDALRTASSSSTSSLAKQQSQIGEGYGGRGRVGFYTHDGQMTEGSSSPSDKFRPPPPRLYPSGGHHQSGVTGVVDRINDIHGRGRVDIVGGVSSNSNSQGHPRHENGDENVEEEQPILDEDMRILRTHLRNPTVEDIRKHFLGTRFFIPQSHASFVVPPSAFRQTKRSASCLRKCMAMGFLHPSQCHSLC